MNIFRISTLRLPYHDIKIEWRNPETPTVKEWTIRAFDGNLSLALLIFCGGLGLFLALGCLFILKLTTLGWWGVVFLTLLVITTSMNTLLQKRAFVIRLTERGGEIFNWRAIPNFIFTSMPWLIAIYVGLVLLGFTLSPELGLGALVGGGGMGILYATVFTSEDYKKNQLDLMHWSFSWDEIYEAIYDHKGHAIGFNVIASKQYITNFKEENENFYGGRIYFHPKMAEQILQIFRNKLDPSITIKEGRIHYRTID